MIKQSKKFLGVLKLTYGLSVIGQGVIFQGYYRLEDHFARLSEAKGSFCKLHQADKSYQMPRGHFVN